MRQYLTPAEVSALLKVNENTVYKWLRGGTLPGVHLGRLWRVPSDWLDKLAAAPSVKRQPAARRGKRKR